MTVVCLILSLFYGPSIRDLASEDFATREAATRRLEQAGLLATPLLKQALSSPDLEVYVRANRILDTTRDRVQSPYIRLWLSIRDKRDERAARLLWDPPMPAVICDEGFVQDYATFVTLVGLCRESNLFEPNEAIPGERVGAGGFDVTTRREFISGVNLMRGRYAAWQRTPMGGP